MAVLPDHFSVLVVHPDPEILVFFARMLAMNGMRALLARTAQEACEIARRDYVPIDLILADVSVRSFGGPSVVERICAIRPEAVVRLTSARVEDGVIVVSLADALPVEMEVAARDEAHPDVALFDSILADCASSRAPLKAWRAGCS